MIRHDDARTLEAPQNNEMQQTRSAMASLPRPESEEIPFSPHMKKVIEGASVEADDSGDSSIRPEHLILGVLVTTSEPASEVLREAGVQISTIREFLRLPPHHQ